MWKKGLPIKTPEDFRAFMTYKAGFIKNGHFKVISPLASGNYLGASYLSSEWIAADHAVDLKTDYLDGQKKQIKGHEDLAYASSPWSYDYWPDMHQAVFQVDGPLHLQSVNDSVLDPVSSELGLVEIPGSQCSVAVVPSVVDATVKIQSGLSKGIVLQYLIRNGKTPQVTSFDESFKGREIVKVAYQYASRQDLFPNVAIVQSRLISLPAGVINITFKPAPLTGVTVPSPVADGVQIVDYRAGVRVTWTYQELKHAVNGRAPQNDQELLRLTMAKAPGVKAQDQALDAQTKAIDSSAGRQRIALEAVIVLAVVLALTVGLIRVIVRHSRGKTG